MSVYSQSDWTPEPFKPSLLASLLKARYPVCCFGLLRASNLDIAFKFRHQAAMLSFSRCSILELSVANQFIIYIQNIYLLQWKLDKHILLYYIVVYFSIKTMNWFHWNHQSPISSRRPFSEKIDWSPFLGLFRFDLIIFPECYVICRFWKVIKQKFSNEECVFPMVMWSEFRMSIKTMTIGKTHPNSFKHTRNRSIWIIGRS